MSAPQTWLMKALQEAEERAAKLPQWAVAINRAHDQQYRYRAEVQP